MNRYAFTTDRGTEKTAERLAHCSQRVGDSVQRSAMKDRIWTGLKSIKRCILLTL